MKKLKNSYDINKALSKKRLGGALLLPTGEYTADCPILIDTPSLRLQGEVWAYNLDPNGVFETRYGTKIRLKGKKHPAISIGSQGIPAGCMISDIGIQGDIIGMDTRGLFDILKPYASAGLYFGLNRIDQGDFSKISCCGLAVGVSCAENSEIDACDFRKINVDGNCLGMYFAPRASYYARFHRCIVADTPSYGFLGEGTGASIHDLSITDTHFVRNSGANHFTDMEHAAVLWKDISACTFKDNLVDDPGTFWYFEPTATDNSDKTVYKSRAIGLYVIGNENRILGNIFSHSSRESILLKGKGNLLMNNIADSDVVIEGEQNTVNGLTFTTESARLILKGSAARNCSVLGVEPDRIMRVLD